MAAKGMKFNPRKSENESMRIIIDCDPGNGIPGANIDDGLALALAIAAPQIALEMITTVAGNTPVDVGYAVARDLITQFLLRSTVVPRVRSWKIRNPGVKNWIMVSISLVYGNSGRMFLLQHCASR
mgnify:CR=1 FL=1